MKVIPELKVLLNKYKDVFPELKAFLNKYKDVFPELKAFLNKYKDGHASSTAAAASHETALHPLPLQLLTCLQPLQPSPTAD